MTAQVLTLFEYESTDELNDREVSLLSQFSRANGIEILRPIIRQGQTLFQARQYVGAIRLGRRTIQILPKIHRSGGKEESIREATQNLLLMLDYTENLGIRETNVAGLNNSQDWFEVLIYLFVSNLQRQWLRGAPRAYESINAVLPVLKGKWRLPAQMHRPEQKHLFAVTYDELTIDNSLNQLFRYVVEKLWQLTQNSQNRKLLFELRYWMEDVTLFPVLTPPMVKNIYLTRLNQQYEPLLNLARLFLEHLGLELSAGDQSAFAFVFDMNQVFEGFLTGFILRHRKDILPKGLQACQMLPQGRQVGYYLAQYQGRPVFRLKPDLVFYINNHYPLLMDFKYKQLNLKSRQLGIAASDLYQMYAYLHRFNSPRVTLIFPQTTNSSESVRSCFELEGGKGEIRIVTVNLFRQLTSKIERQKLMEELMQILEEGDG